MFFMYDFMDTNKWNMSQFHYLSFTQISDLHWLKMATNEIYVWTMTEMFEKVLKELLLNYSVSQCHLI